MTPGVLVAVRFSDWPMHTGELAVVIGLGGMAVTITGTVSFILQPLSVAVM